MSCTTILYPRCLCPIQWLNPSFRDTRLLQSALCVFGCKRWKPCWFLILACNLGNNSPSMPRTIKNVGRQLVISFPLWCNCHTRQPSFSSERLGTIVVTEWLGKCLFRIVTFDYSGCRVRPCFSSRDQPTGYREYLCRAQLSLRKNQVVPLFHRLFMYLLLIFRLLTRAWCWMVSGLHPWQAWQRRYLARPVCPCIWVAQRIEILYVQCVKIQFILVFKLPRYQMADLLLGLTANAVTLV